MKQENYTGIILRVFDSGYSDRVVHIVADDGSKIAILAKGARKPNSRKQGALVIGNEIETKAVLGYALPIMYEVRINHEYAAWKGHPKDMTLMQCMLEATTFFCQEQHPEPQIYQSLQTALRQSDARLFPKVLALYLLRLLSITGNIHDVMTDVETGVDLRNTSVLSSQLHAGYVAEPTARYGPSPSQSRIIKSQKYITQHSFPDSMRLSLQEEEIMTMLKTHINWIELAAEREMKSKRVLQTLMQ